MTAEEFYRQYFKTSDKGFIYLNMIEFAEAFAEQQNKQLTDALELALEALEDAHVMGDFSDDIEAIKEVLNKEQ